MLNDTLNEQGTIGRGPGAKKRAKRKAALRPM